MDLFEEFDLLVVKSEQGLLFYGAQQNVVSNGESLFFELYSSVEPLQLDDIQRGISVVKSHKLLLDAI